MNITLTPEISFVLSNAKLVFEDEQSGTIEFMFLNQPFRLNIDKAYYSYDINLNVGDRVNLLENYGAFGQNSKGTLKEIIPDNTEDKVKVLFDEIIPDQIIKPVQVNVESSMASVLVELPLRLIEKI